MNQSTRRSYKYFIQFLLIGFFAGLIPPVSSTIVEALRNDISISCFSCLVEYNLGSYLLLVMDSTPLVVGALAGLVGFRQDRVEELALETANQLEEQTRLRRAFEDLTLELEDRVENRTKSLELRTRYLEAAADVGRAATSIYQLEELLPQVVNFISQRFGFYQVGIFIIDNTGEFAIMQAASSEGGQRMLARNHRLKVGEQGIVGYVSSTGQARIALDVGEDAVHFDNPELPDTRSEMALPLFYGGRLVGALDVQSTEQNAFSEEDISALRVLADQVSMAINNATLFGELQSSLEVERKLFGDISLEAWHEMIRKGSNQGYVFSRGRQQVFPAEKSWPPEMVDAMLKEVTVSAITDRAPVIAIPIKVSDQVIGVIRLGKNAGDMDWTENEIEFMETITDRFSQALEGARLFQQTQKQAAQEQITSTISSQFRQSLDLDSVLKTAAKELSEAFNANEVIIRMTSDD
ncbi:MAG: GAF domain-containing protein [Chloroflexota bacterium]